MTDIDELVEENDVPTEIVPGIWTDEGRAAWLLERDKRIVDYIISGGYTPADRNVDLRTIERFVFSGRGSWHFLGYGLVIDILHNDRVYFSPPGEGGITHLEFAEYSAEFRDDDLDRLILAIEESGLLDWNPTYEREFIPYGDAETGPWRVGILFSDGTMLRREGWLIADEGHPPEEQFRILSDFVQTLGQEIIERHNAEQEQVEVLSEHLYGRWAQWYGALIDGYFEMFESGVGIIYFLPDGIGTYAGMWDDGVIYFAWQISGNEITMIDCVQEKVGTISWGTDSPEELNRDEIVISWLGTSDPDWGLFRR